MTPRLSHRFRPTDSIDLLLRARLLADEPAAAAWRRWSAVHAIDRAAWPEIRLLVALSPRAAIIAPDAAPRLATLARTHWSVTQSILRESAPALDLLAAHDIPCLVFKGAAQYADGLAARRLLGDLDLLVPAPRILPAVEALVAEGWEGQKGESLAYHRAVWPTRIGGNFFRGRHGEIDLHRVPFHVSRHVPALDAALWRDARAATLVGRTVLVPDPADAILLTLAHAVGGSGGDWALDVAARVAAEGVDWDRLAASAIGRELALPALAGLSYVADALAVPVPPAILADLGRAQDGPLARRAFAAMTRVRGRAHVQSAEDRLNRALRAAGYDAPSGDRFAVPVVQPRWSAPWRRRVAGDARTTAEIDVPAGASSMLLRLGAPTPPTIQGARPRLVLDATLDGIAFAQMQARFHRRPSERLRPLTFKVPLPAAASGRRVTIAASAPPPRPPQTLTKERDRCAPGTFVLEAVTFRK